MKLVAVYLTDAPAEGPPVAAFPGPRTEELEQRIADFVARNYPGRPYELRDQDAQDVEARKPH
ncbi:MAG TPA: hypothetical protein VHO06_22780 [Polyangia bacterium]|nr:hypothetical protein [Polyangia bacterium]